MIAFNMVCAKLVVIAICITTVLANGRRYEKRQAGRSAALTDNPDVFIFPDAVDAYKKRVETNSSEQMQLDFARRLNEVDNFDALISNYLDEESRSEPGIGTRFGAISGSPTIAKPASCTPELTVVELTPNRDPSLFYLPMCTRVPRCGGCCNNLMLACEPVGRIHKQHLIYELNQLAIPPTKRIINVTVEEHTRCRCSCVVKQHHCTERQIYLENQCRCACNNYEEEIRCNNNNNNMPRKYWDNTKCSCECSETSNCSTGTFFDRRTCRCARRL